MKISSNKLKKYIKDSESIDWKKIWELFTIRTAEVEQVIEKGTDMKDVVVGQILECVIHPTKDKYHLLKVSDGEKIYSILCGAPNVRVGLKAPLVKIGGMVSGITIKAKKIAGFISEGMLCSGMELGINYETDGIIELPDDAEVGMNLKDYLPIDDIIVEIDNKSLTNRPDLWGHYGIAREVAAITNHELLNLEIENMRDDKNNLNINVSSPEFCKRYCAIKINNVVYKKTSLEDQIFLCYVGMRPISLIVDLTNIIMLELGQPMHAFDSRVVKNIEVGLANSEDTFVTLDGMERKLSKDVLMIKNDNKYFGIAGIMGGLDSEIKSDTTSIMLESATFEATNIRKTATSLGLRTEASSRYEKSLDPEMTELGIKRYIALLRRYNPDLEIVSNLTDIKDYVKKENKVELTKKMLKTYIDEEITEDEVINILKSLEFKVKNEDDRYIVTIPSFRATKDIKLEVDLIEEIARMYGYENIKPKALNIDITFKEHEFDYTEMYNIKKFLASRYSLNEVHTYLWYDTMNLKRNGISKENITIINKNDNNILRDDLTLSLLDIVKMNLKKLDKANIFEIGTIIKNGKNKTSLSIIFAEENDQLENNYNLACRLVVELFKYMKNKKAVFIDTKTEDYYYSDYAKEIIVDNRSYGTVNIAKINIGKKKVAVCVEIDIDELLLLKKQPIEIRQLSKYPSVSLDYTILASVSLKYKELENIINKFCNRYIIDYKLIGLYNDGLNNKYTVRYTVGSNDKTMEQFELNLFKESFISHIKKNNLEIIE